MVGAVRDENNGNPSDSDVQVTPERATAMLPLVRQIVAELTRLNESIENQRLQVNAVTQWHETSDMPAYKEELNDIHSTIAEEEARFHECLQELNSLGVSPHFPIDGTVDFPTSLNRRRVHLCWSPGDEAVTHWHEVGEGPGDRKRIDRQTFGVQNMN